jgi:hypothetical protein
MARLEKQVLRPAAGDKGDVAALAAVSAEPENRRLYIGARR